MIEFPVTPEALLAVGGLAFLVAVVVQLAKAIKACKEERSYNIIAIVTAQVVAIAAALVNTEFHPSPELVFQAAVVALFAAALATLGYELVFNLAGMVGYGPRSDKAKVAKATALVAKLRR